MPVTLKIQNLRNINELDFEIPRPGAYLLTGSNGAGKTSLLTCLHRLRNGGAFQRGFRSSAHPSLDSHRNGSVKYTIDGQEVTYTYVEERWAPLPRKNSKLLAQCGFPEVRYIAADAQRVEPKQEDFAPKRVRLTDQPIREAMKQIFDSDRFDELCHVNLNRGGQNRAYLIRQRDARGNAVYFSEKNFSLGELCVLKLMLLLNDLPDRSLLLIDELELAIHPRAQTKLFDYLKNFAENKRLTIIFSTHSVTLIKYVDRKQILFLNSVNGNVSCERGCYPTFALGHIASSEEANPDSVILVEDDSARKCVEAMIELHRLRTLNRFQPTIVTLPLGGYSQILSFLDRAPRLFPDRTTTYALLDQDVATESLAEFRRNNNYEQLGLFQRLGNQVLYLPWTPEVGLVRLLQRDPNLHQQQLREYFADNRLNIDRQRILGIDANIPGRQSRDSCKRLVNEITDDFCATLGRQKDTVRGSLFKYLIDRSTVEEKNAYSGLVGRAFG